MYGSADCGGVSSTSSVQLHCAKVVTPGPDGSSDSFTEVDEGDTTYNEFDVWTWRNWYVLLGVHNAASDVPASEDDDLSLSVVCGYVLNNSSSSGGSSRSRREAWLCETEKGISRLECEDIAVAQITAVDAFGPSMAKCLKMLSEVQRLAHELCLAG